MQSYAPQEAPVSEILSQENATWSWGTAAPKWPLDSKKWTHISHLDKILEAKFSNCHLITAGFKDWPLAKPGLTRVHQHQPVSGRAEEVSSPTLQGEHTLPQPTAAAHHQAGLLRPKGRHKPSWTGTKGTAPFAFVTHEHQVQTK